MTIKAKPDFSNLNYEGFRQLAQDKNLSKYERIGFPDSYRAGYESLIFADITEKLSLLQTTGKTVVDVGPGCTELPRMIIDLCEKQGHTLVLLDSAEMLALLPDRPFIVKIAGLFPQTYEETAAQIKHCDVLLCYSVLHYVYVDSNLFDFFDCALSLLNPGGQMLVGDVPNVSMRKRFFSSQAGIDFHRQYTGAEELPDVRFMQVEQGKIDDAVILGLLQRVRNSGAHAYVVPQSKSLPMANRREDILIYRP